MVTGEDLICDIPDNAWDSSIIMDGYTSDQLCTVLATTADENGDEGNCADWCAA